MVYLVTPPPPEAHHAAAALQPVTPAPPHTVRPVTLTQRWQHLTFLHWRIDPGAAARLMPPGVRPDVAEDSSYVGLVAFHTASTGLAGLPGLPYAGVFSEINVRLYSVGPDGRRGVVFRSLDASRLLPVAAARAALRLPYQWSGMRVKVDGDDITYTSRRRWPGPRGAGLRLAVHVGERIPEPSPLEHFLTARWGLHATWYLGRPCYLPIEHPPWSLRRARLTGLTETLVEAAGLPAPAGEPFSVLYATGVPFRAGLPQFLPRPRRTAGGPAAK
jgi:uncharacterized protein YqjF (DUF2071 family)